MTVRSRMNFLLGVFGGVFPLILAAAPIGSGLWRVAWLTPTLGLTALVLVRAVRMGVTANDQGLVVRNLGRDYHLRWTDIDEIEAGRSNNISGGVTTINIRRSDGSVLVGRGASSYSRSKVEGWRDQLGSVRPGRQ